MIAVADTMKEDSPKAIAQLQQYGNPCGYAYRGQ